MERTPKTTTPSLCARGCGFWGAPENKNLCSKCYKDYLMEVSARQLAKLEISSDETSAGTAPVKPESATSAEKSESVAVWDAKPSEKKRCKNCNKKVGLLGFHCRCGHVYCGVHRYPEFHSCPVDHQAIARAALAKQHPVVSGDKLEFRT